MRTGPTRLINISGNVNRERLFELITKTHTCKDIRRVKQQFCQKHHTSKARDANAKTKYVKAADMLSDEDCMLESRLYYVLAYP